MFSAFWEANRKQNSTFFSPIIHKFSTILFCKTASNPVQNLFFIACLGRKPQSFGERSYWVYTYRVSTLWGRGFHPAVDTHLLMQQEYIYWIMWTDTTFMFRRVKGHVPIKWKGMHLTSGWMHIQSCRCANSFGAWLTFLQNANTWWETVYFLTSLSTSENKMNCFICLISVCIYICCFVSVWKLIKKTPKSPRTKQS